jgi:hypothetical protein
MKTKTIKHIGYVINGTADLTLWGDGNASITMKPIIIKDINFDYNNEDNIKPLLNDNGFGCQSINGAIIDISELYECNVQELIKSEVTIGNVSDNTLDNFYTTI